MPGQVILDSIIGKARATDDSSSRQEIEESAGRYSRFHAAPGEGQNVLDILPEMEAAGSDVWLGILGLSSGGGAQAEQKTEP
jgi:hypothetical protein